MTAQSGYERIGVLMYYLNVWFSNQHSLYTVVANKMTENNNVSDVVKTPTVNTYTLNINDGEKRKNANDNNHLKHITTSFKIN